MALLKETSMRNSEMDQPTNTEKSKELYEWVQALVCSVLAVVLLFTFVIRMIGVDGHSMLPTLQHGDRLLVLNSLWYDDYKYGDIVILRKEGVYNDDPIVKRVIATGGQTVEIDYQKSRVYVDGKAVSEPYIKEFMVQYPYQSITSITVPEGCIFVMGDNRNNSDDSRNPNLGVVDERLIVGKAILVIFPFSNIHKI